MRLTDGRQSVYTERMRTVRILDADLYGELRRRAARDTRSLQSYVNLILTEHCQLLPPGAERAGDATPSARPRGAGDTPRRPTGERRAPPAVTRAVPKAFSVR